MTTWVKRLILANVAVFILTAAAPMVYRAMVLVPALVLQRPWTLFTYMFLHAGLGHIFFNMLALFFFGPRLEVRLGARDFLLLYFLSGLGGAVLSFLLAPGAAVVGASGAVFGVLLGFALYWPDEPIYIWGVLPIKARWLVFGLAALSLVSGVTGAASGIAHFAHLGGFAAGWLFLKWHERRSPGPALGDRTRAFVHRVSGQEKRQVERWRSIRLDGLHEINRAEVERILRKVERHGVQSLTPDERAFMERMSQRQ